MQSFHTTINSIAYRGNGVGRIDGKAVFIPHVLEGEKVEAVIIRDHKRHAEAALKQVITPSDKRCEPACEHYEHCPGCCYRHMAYPEEIRAKQQQLEYFLRDIITPGTTIAAPVPAPKRDGYRNKITLHIPAETTPGQPGYIGADNTTLFPVQHCPLAAPEINDFLKQLPELPEGATRLTIRHTPADSTRHWTDVTPPAKTLLTENTPIGQLRVPAASFYQINPLLANQLMSEVQQQIKHINPSSVIDLFCGVGIFAMLAAAVTPARIRGIDIDSNAIKTARTNAAAHHFDHIRFECCPAEKALSGYQRTRADQDVWILDPPRTGLKKQTVHYLLEHAPRYIMYISCAPDTLARDLKRLCHQRYTLKKVQLFDMFPQTYCFETIALLTRQ